MDYFLYVCVVFGALFWCCIESQALNNLDTVYTNNFTVKIRDSVDIKKSIPVLNREGFNLVYHIVSNFYLFNRPDIQSYSAQPLDVLTVQGYQRALDEFVETIEQNGERRVSTGQQHDRIPNNLLIQNPFQLKGQLPIRPPVKLKDGRLRYLKPDEFHSNILVGVVDVQFDLHQENYKGNIVHSLCYDFIQNSRYSGIRECFSQFVPWFSHGTYCMGRIAAKGLNGCDAGVNPKSLLVALRVISNTLYLSAERLARAFVYQLDNIHILSCSFGTPDNYGFVPLEESTKAALKEGVELGRECKGRIVVVPSGNGHIDNCNADGYANSIDTITVANVDREGHLPPNKEVCPCALIAAKGDGYKTTDVCDRCSRRFAGSSASTASGAGLISILLSVNPYLSKRDVEHILVRCASKEQTDKNITWHKNGAGFEFNEQIGFGIPNRNRMIELASRWKYVPKRHTCVVEHKGPDQVMMHNYLVVSFQSNGCRNTEQSVKHLEHVQLEVHIKCPQIISLEIDLISPNGTISSMLSKINSAQKVTKQYADFNWTFMSTNFWGEDPYGIWNVTYRMKYISLKGTCIVVSQKLVQRGTSAYPQTDAIPLQCIKKDIEDDDKSLPGWKIALIVIFSCLFVILAVVVTMYIVCCRQIGGSNRCDYSVSYVRQLVFSKFDNEAPYNINPSARDGYTDSTHCLISPDPSHQMLVIPTSFSFRK